MGVPAADGRGGARLHRCIGNVRLRVRLDAVAQPTYTAGLMPWPAWRSTCSNPGCPSSAPRPGRIGDWTRSWACWFAFVVLTGLSLWCAYGTTATQLAERLAHRAVASDAKADRTTTRDRLRKQRDALMFAETSADTVKTAEVAVKAAAAQVKAERDRGGCRGHLPPARSGRAHRPGGPAQDPGRPSRHHQGGGSSTPGSPTRRPSWARSTSLPQ